MLRVIGWLLFRILRPYAQSTRRTLNTLQIDNHFCTQVYRLHRCGRFGFFLGGEGGIRHNVRGNMYQEISSLDKRCSRYGPDKPRKGEHFKMCHLAVAVI